MTPTSTPPWHDYVHARLDALASRGEDPTTETVERVRVLVANWFPDWLPIPSVVPGDEHGVEFIWERNGMDVSLELVGDTAVGDDTLWCREQWTTNQSVLIRGRRVADLWPGVARQLLTDDERRG